jgi:hypothetical protein
LEVRKKNSKISNLPSVWAHRTVRCAPDTALCTVQCIGRARSKSIFLCAVRWFTGQLLCAVRCAPDRHCRLSGAPISRFKKMPPARAEPEALKFLPSLCLSALLWRSDPLADDHRAPASTVLRRPPALIPSPSGEQSCLHSSLFSLFSLVSSPPPLLGPNQFPVNSSESKWWNVFPCVS